MTTQARELAKLVTNAGDVNLVDDISLASDGAILNFGADNDVTLTHVADTGLLLNSSRQIQFGDSGTHIRQSADGVLQLTSDTEVEINATTVDINANVDISGNLVLGGNITIGDADSDDISFGGELTSHIVPNADDTYDLGSSTKQWRNLYVDGSAYIDTIDGTDETTITNTDTGSSAGPIVSLYRNSSSAADADYLGQFKFQGENDADQQVNYAKITGKILDASDGSEDGILEFAHIKAGSQTITGRWRSDSLQLLNGTNLSVAGTLTVTGETTLETHLNMGDSDIIKLGAGADLQIQHNGSNSLIGESGTGDLYIYGENNIYLTNNVSGSENYLSATKDGAVTLFYDNTAELVTISGGVKANNKLGVNSNASNAALEVVATSGEVFRADANNGAFRLVADQTDVKASVMRVTGGAVSAPSYSFIGDTTTGISRPTGSTVNVVCGGTERYRFDANGRFGVGGTPNSGHSSSASIQIIGQSTATADYVNNNFNAGSLLSLDADNAENHYASIRFTHEGGTEGFFGYVRQTASSDIADFIWQGYEGDSNTYREYMRLTHAGHLAINGANSGTTGANKTAAAYSTLTVQTGSSNGDVATNGAFSHVGPINTAANANADGYISGMSFGYFEGNSSYRHTAIAARAHGDGAARRDMVFLVNGAVESASAALADAKLTISSGNGVVSGDLNDTSDLGFKENVADLGNTLSIVNQLKPRTFTWKDERANRGDSVGFIAQEVKSVVSDNTLVQGEEYDPDNLKMTGYSLNTIGLVAYLTKAIQELEARITTLEG